LGIETHFELWKYFFTADLQKEKLEKKKKMADLAVLMGCTNICLQSSRVSEYMPIPLRKSNKGWRKFWFYLKNDAVVPLPILFGRYIEEASDVWRYGPVAKT
jgi:hypothetical protein